MVMDSIWNDCREKTKNENELVKGAVEIFEDKGKTDKKVDNSAYKNLVLLGEAIKAGAYGCCVYGFTKHGLPGSITCAIAAVVVTRVVDGVIDEARTHNERKPIYSSNGKRIGSIDSVGNIYGFLNRLKGSVIDKGAVLNNREYESVGKICKENGHYTIINY